MKHVHFTHSLTALALAALLAACGGGGDSPDTATAQEAAPDAAQAMDGDSDEYGRKQALAVNPPALSPAPPGLSGNVVCVNWRIGAITLDNVEVAPGAACQLNGTRILGSLQAQQAAVIDANRVTVSGSVQSQEGAHVTVRNSSQIAGDVNIEGGGAFTMINSRALGGVEATGLLGALTVRGNTVGGNMQITDNLGGGLVRNNRITGNLQCTGNAPAPLASGNTAALIEDQCIPGTGGGGNPVAPPLSGNVTCVGLTIGAIPLDSVFVPAGATCTLLGTTLNGSIEVGANARLVADGVAVTGGLTSDGAAQVSVSGSSGFGGSVQLQRGASASMVGASVTGDLQIDAMTGPVVASANRITGNVQAMANRGGLTMSGNRIGGVMQCKDNLPAPVGSGNVASQKQDQCLGL